MAKTFYEHIIASGGISGESSDINIGPLHTDVIDVLLKDASTTSILQENTPLHIISTGALTGTRILDLSGAEINGRLILLSIQNSDISTFNLTIISSNTINGAANFIVSSIIDLIFIHSTSGVWRVISPSSGSGAFTTIEKSNLELEMEFKAAQLTNFKEFTYTGKNLTAIDIYTDNTKTTKLFNKVLSYTGTNLTQTILTRVSDSATLTNDLVYSGNDLISIEAT